MGLVKENKQILLEKLGFVHVAFSFAGSQGLKC